DLIRIAAPCQDVWVSPFFLRPLVLLAHIDWLDHYSFPAFREVSLQLNVCVVHSLYVGFFTENTASFRAENPGFGKNVSRETLEKNNTSRSLARSMTNP
ncbi:MAG: hypothetical protein JSW47_20490, partial [Phycisphaerales bacterium]